MLEQSETLRQRAERVLAGGPATLSKHYSRFPQAQDAPEFLVRGEGANVWDIDGRGYLDTIAGLGPVLLGHNHPGVTEAVWAQSECLATSSLSTALEVEAAERLIEMIPGAEQVRFASNGADVTNAAVKVARYITGKKHAIFCGYHGMHDSYLSTTDKDGGLLPQLSTFNHQVRWRDMDQLGLLLGEIGDDLACFMVEVPPEPWGMAAWDTASILRRYKKSTHAHRGLFILDEIVTGLRYGLGGAQAYYGVTADMATMSKALGNGYPIAALMGPRALMRVFEGGHVFLSTTFGANPVSLAACKATLDVLRDTDALEQLRIHGQLIGDYIARAIARLNVPMHLRGNYARMVLDFHEAPGRASAAELRTLWLQELLALGILASVPLFLMTCYTNETVLHLRAGIAEALRSIDAVCDGKESITDILRCPVIEDIFAKRHAVATVY